jgi:hypothetical protein
MAEEMNGGSAVAMEAAMKFFAMMTDSVKFYWLLTRLEHRSRPIWSSQEPFVGPIRAMQYN